MIEYKKSLVNLNVAETQEYIEQEYSDATNQIACDDLSRADYLNIFIFKFTDYNDSVTFYVKKAMEVCSAITFGTICEYIGKNNENKQWFSIICNMPFFKEKITRHSLIDCVKWTNEIEFVCSGLWNDEGFYPENNLHFEKKEWEIFIKALILFLGEEEVVSERG